MGASQPLDSANHPLSCPQQARAPHYAQSAKIPHASVMLAGQGRASIKHATTLANASLSLDSVRMGRSQCTRQVRNAQRAGPRRTPRACASQQLGSATRMTKLLSDSVTFSHVIFLESDVDQGFA